MKQVELIVFECDTCHETEEHFINQDGLDYVEADEYCCICGGMFYFVGYEFGNIYD